MLNVLLSKHWSHTFLAAKRTLNFELLNALVGVEGVKYLENLNQIGTLHSIDVLLVLKRARANVLIVLLEPKRVYSKIRSNMFIKVLMVEMFSTKALVL